MLFGLYGAVRRSTTRKSTRQARIFCSSQKIICEYNTFVKSSMLYSDMRLLRVTALGNQRQYNDSHIFRRPANSDDLLLLLTHDERAHDLALDVRLVSQQQRHPLAHAQVQVVAPRSRILVGEHGRPCPVGLLNGRRQILSGYINIIPVRHTRAIWNFMPVKKDACRGIWSVPCAVLQVNKSTGLPSFPRSAARFQRGRLPDRTTAQFPPSLEKPFDQRRPPLYPKLFTSSSGVTDETQQYCTQLNMDLHTVHAVSTRQHALFVYSVLEYIGTLWWDKLFQVIVTATTATRTTT